MSLVGLYCESGELLQEIETAFNMARLKSLCREQKEGSPPPGGGDIDGNCRLQVLESLEEGGQLWQGQMFFLILACGTAEKTFAAAEGLWEKTPGLSIVCVARRPEEVFAALPYPFFHVIRDFALEQDLGAVLSKIERAGSLLPRWCAFQGKDGLVRVRLKEILYLESDRHEIRVHMEENRTSLRDAPGEQGARAGAFLTVETLAQCEEKLRAFGVARIHKSFLVNLYHVAKLEKDRLALDSGRQLYISRHRYPEVKLQFESYIRHMGFL